MQWHKTAPGCLLVGAALTGLLIGGCGGGAGVSPGGVVGLEVPSQMSVVTATGGGGSSKPSAMKATLGSLSKAFGDVDTDYSTDPVDIWVHDSSMEPLEIVNEILCMMAQTRADVLVNQGSYIALIDADACQQGAAEGDGTSGQSAGGGKSTEYEKWVVNSTRADNGSAQVVHLWVPGDNDGGPAGDIHVEVTVTEGVSADKPFGEFVLNFAFVTAGVADGGGTLKTVPAPAGKVAFTFFENAGTRQANPADYTPGESFNEMIVSVEMSPDGASGVARTSSYFAGNWGGGTYEDGGAFAVAFDSAHMKRGEAADLTDVGTGTFSAEVCLDRNAYDVSTWRYDLYHAADGTHNGQAVLGGDRVAMNSGFPFVYDNGGSEVFGHIGYWGMWVEDPAVVIPHGATIHERDHQTEALTPYTVVKAPGKLVRRVANNLPVAKLSGELLNYWGEMDPGTGPRFGQWVVRYLTVAGDGVPADGFYGVAEQTGWDQSGPITTPFGAPVDITPAANGFLGLWSDSLGGAVNFVGGATAVTFYADETVGGDDPVFAGGALTLNCFERCLKGGVAQADVDAGWNGVYLADATDLNTGVTLYTVDPADMTLKAGGVPVVMVAGVTLAGTDHEWGMGTGEMVTTAVKGAMTNMWDIWDPNTVAVSYRWETGPNDWNRYTAVTDGGGAYVSFDKPIQFAYEHTTANDANGDATYDGKTVRLNYGGNGDLWGVPSNVDANGRWTPQFTIADGTLMGPGGTEYVIKAREKEQSMSVVALGTCGGLALTAPTAALPTTPDGAPAIGPKPVLTTAPAVIGGEMQTTGGG